MMATTLGDAIRAVGFEPPKNIPAGQTLRFSTNGKNSDKAGWLYLFPDGVGAAFGCNRSGEQHTWQAPRDKPLNKIEQAAFKQKTQSCKQASTIEKAASYQQVAKVAQAEWNGAALAPESHPYLIRKGIRPNTARIDTHGNLLIPVYGLDGEIQSLQRIAPDGQKRFFKGSCGRTPKSVRSKLCLFKCL